jgi:transposase InsO family protein
MSMARRRVWQQQLDRRLAEESARQLVATVCHFVQTQQVPVAHVTRCLSISDRTVRRWRSRTCALSDACPVTRGRPSQPATRQERNLVYQFVKERGAGTPLASVQAAFPHLRRADLLEVLRRYRTVARIKRQRRQSRLHWRRAGAVWAADFKERREPIEGRYSSILAVKDLASRFQLAWLPVPEATADVVQETYARLFAEHGPPLVLKSDNGGQFRDERTKQLLAEHDVVPLFNPRRRPGYNGGVERANGQLAGYQEAVAAAQGRAGLPTCADAEQARQLANDLARPEGWRGPTAGQLWQQRQPVTIAERASFLAAVSNRRLESRAALHLPLDEPLPHYPQAAVDRRAVRDALVAQELLHIEPRRKRRAGQGTSAQPELETHPPEALAETNAGTIPSASMVATPTVGVAAPLEPTVVPPGNQPTEEVHSSTNKSAASGQD